MTIEKGTQIAQATTEYTEGEELVSEAMAEMAEIQENINHISDDEIVDNGRQKQGRSADVMPPGFQLDGPQPGGISEDHGKGKYDAERENDGGTWETAHIHFQHENHRNQVRQLLKKHQKIFSKHNYDIGSFTVGGRIQKVKLKVTDKTPIVEKYRQISPAKRETAEAILNQLEKATNMIRPSSNTNKVVMNYTVSAPRMYKGNIDSLVSKMTPYADLVQLTHLKLQQAIQRMVPSGVYLDADGIAEVDLGNGTNYNAQEALNMYFQTGSIIGRSLTVEGDPNPGKVPIQELPGSQGNQIQILIAAYNNYIQMMRDVTGLNEARDGSDPDPNALVGVQKLAAANSNVATRHILDSSMFITLALAENICLRFKDVLEFHPTKEAFIGALGQFSVASLEEMENLHLHDFGIFLELMPDEEEKTILEANIQMALSKESINLEDAIDIREVKNLKLANQLLKIRRIRKQAADQQAAEAASVAQAEAQGQAQIQVEQAKAQAEQIKTESKIQYREADIGFEIKKLEVEAATKRELMQYEYELNVKLKELELNAQKELANANNENMMERENVREAGANEREGMKISAKSVVGPPSSGKPAKSFESKGNDVLGGIDLSRFSPK